MSLLKRKNESDLNVQQPQIVPQQSYAQNGMISPHNFNTPNQQPRIPLSGPSGPQMQGVYKNTLGNLGLQQNSQPNYQQNNTMVNQPMKPNQGFDDFAFTPNQGYQQNVNQAQQVNRPARSPVKKVLDDDFLSF